MVHMAAMNEPEERVRGRATPIDISLPSMALIPGTFFAQIEGILLVAAYLLCWLVLAVIWIIVCIWVYRDANSRGMDGVLWLIVVLVGSFIGLLIYLIIREEHVPYAHQSPPQYTPRTSTGVSRCPGCGSPVDAGWKMCPYCGRTLGG